MPFSSESQLGCTGITTRVPSSRTIVPGSTFGTENCQLAGANWRDCCRTHQQERNEGSTASNGHERRIGRVGDSVGSRVVDEAQVDGVPEHGAEVLQAPSQPRRIPTTKGGTASQRWPKRGQTCGPWSAPSNTPGPWRRYLRQTRHQHHRGRTGASGGDLPCRPKHASAATDFVRTSSVQVSEEGGFDQGKGARIAPAAMMKLPF